MKLNLVILENKRNVKSEIYNTLKIGKVDIKLMWATLTRTEKTLTEIFTKNMDSKSIWFFWKAISNNWKVGDNKIV